MNERRILARAERNAFRNALAHAKTRRGRLDGRTIHAEPSDDGRAASALYDALEPEPHWLKLWRQGRRTLKPRHRAVLDALLVDLRPRVTARIAGVGKDLVYACLGKIFKVHFAQCFRAYRALFEE